MGGRCGCGSSGCTLLVFARPAGVGPCPSPRAQSREAFVSGGEVVRVPVVARESRKHSPRVSIVCGVSSGVSISSGCGDVRIQVRPVTVGGVAVGDSSCCGSGPSVRSDAPLSASRHPTRKRARNEWREIQWREIKWREIKWREIKGEKLVARN